MIVTSYKLAKQSK